MSSRPIARRQAIRSRLASASQGPWELVPTATVYMSGHCRYLIRNAIGPSSTFEMFSFMPDAEFVAHAWEDIDFLLESTSALIDERDQLLEELNEQSETVKDLRQQLKLESKPRRTRKDTDA